MQKSICAVSRALSAAWQWVSAFRLKAKVQRLDLVEPERNMAHRETEIAGNFLRLSGIAGNECQVVLTICNMPCSLSGSQRTAEN
jgi:hypothetical protein